MDTLLCNRCGHSKKFSSEERTYFVSSCGHVFCQQCGARVETCPLCNAKCRLVEISSEASQDIQAYFKEPMVLLQQLVGVLQFQKTQSKIFMQLVKKIFDNQKSVQNIQSRCDRLEKENQELRDRLQAAENRERQRQAQAAAAAAAQIHRVSPTIMSSTPGVQPFIQQTMDPSFHALFGDGLGHDNRNDQFGITPHPHIGDLITPPSEPRNPPGSAGNREAAGIRRGQHAPIERRFPAAFSSMGNIPATPRPGHGLNRQPNNGPPPSAGGDIMSRLQRLRW